MNKNISMSKTIAVVDIELDKPRKIKYTNGAFRKFKEVTGQSAFKISPDDFNDYISELLWSGLLHEDREITVGEIDDLVGPSNMYYVISKITEAWGLAMPEAPTKEEGHRPLV